MLYISKIFAFTRFVTYKKYIRNGTKYYKYKNFSLLCDVTSSPNRNENEEPRTEEHFPYDNYLQFLK
jgi:hypothetical protein